MSPSSTQSLCDFRLHGVSHDVASPMPANVAIIIGYLRCLHQLLFYFPHGFSIVPLDVGGQWINTGGTETKTYKTAFWRCQCFAPVVSVAVCLISSRCLNQPHHTPNAALPSEGGGIAKRIKTARLRRKTKPGRNEILHVRP